MLPYVYMYLDIIQHYVLSPYMFREKNIYFNKDKKTNTFVIPNYGV